MAPHKLCSVYSSFPWRYLPAFTSFWVSVKVKSEDKFSTKSSCHSSMSFIKKLLAPTFLLGAILILAMESTLIN